MFFAVLAGKPAGTAFFCRRGFCTPVGAPGCSAESVFEQISSLALAGAPGRGVLHMPVCGSFCTRGVRAGILGGKRFLKNKFFGLGGCTP